MIPDNFVRGNFNAILQGTTLKPNNVEIRIMKLYIKNMVCNRCSETVKAELDKLHIKYSCVKPGEVTLRKKITEIQYNLLLCALEQSGFELITRQENNLIEKLKGAIVDIGLNSDKELKTSCPDFISLMLNNSFIKLNELFSEIEGMTIQKYIIMQKVNNIKKLLGHKNMNITEIAEKMHYSNVAQLSSEFKSITGLTPDHFRQLRQIIN